MASQLLVISYESSSGVSAVEFIAPILAAESAVSDWGARLSDGRVFHYKLFGDTFFYLKKEGEFSARAEGSRTPDKAQTLNKQQSSAR